MKSTVLHRASGCATTPPRAQSRPNRHQWPYRDVMRHDQQPHTPTDPVFQPRPPRQINAKQDTVSAFVLRQLRTPSFPTTTERRVRPYRQHMPTRVRHRSGRPTRKLSCQVGGSSSALGATLSRLTRRARLGRVVATHARTEAVEEPQPTGRTSEGTRRSPAGGGTSAGRGGSRPGRLHLR